MEPRDQPAKETAPKGLSDTEASARLANDGPNELPRQRRRDLLRVALDVLREPMLALLVAGGVIYLLLGDLGEALILLVFACLSVLITVIQESRTERVLEALRDLTSPPCAGDPRRRPEADSGPGSGARGRFAPGRGRPSARRCPCAQLPGPAGR